jgi:hypothetical protein
MRKPLEKRSAGLRGGSAQEGYDPSRRAACESLLRGPVRAGAARRLVELVLVPRDHADELGEIFDEMDRIAPAPAMAELVAVAARATAAHTCRGARSLTGSVATIAAAIERRFSACESGQAGYPLTLSGLGLAGRYGLEKNLSSVYLTHTLERIVESALLIATVIEPACAPGAYAVTSEPRDSTTAEIRSVLAGHLARHQNATIDFALEELTSRDRREPVAADHLQYLLLAASTPVDVEQLVVWAHALVLCVCDDVELEAELSEAARILDASGLSGEGWLALGGAVGAITSLLAALLAALHGARAADGLTVQERPALHGRRPVTGRRSLGGCPSDPDELARSVLRVALVAGWCARYGKIRPGVIALDRTRRIGA